MKQFKLYSGMAAVCAMLMFASCGNDIELTEAQAPAKGEYKVTFTASQEGSATRTAVDGANVVWQTGDAITVFDGAGVACPFELAKGAGTTLGEFQGTITVTEPKSYCAVYPAMESATIDSDYGISGLSLPVEQVATPNGFDPLAAIMTARNDNADKITSTSEDLSLGTFKHVCAFVKVTTTEDYDKITFTAKGGEGIAGGFTVTLDENGISTVTPAADASTTVSLVPVIEGTKIAAGTYLIAILPGVLEKGFTMSCSSIDKETSTVTTMVRSFNQSTVAFSRRNVVNMGTVEEGATAAVWTKVTQQYVDLGLSVKWATCNVGATIPEGNGDYYAWGETSMKDDYSWGTYKWCDANNNNSMTKYNDFDGKSILDACDDAAHINWGGAWRMPTNAEMEELYNTENCKWEWTSQNNVNGYKVTSLKDGYTDKFIFLPAAGFRSDTGYNPDDSYGLYWSASLGESDPNYAWYVTFSSSYLIYRNDGSRYCGFSVRPVFQ
jgi:uncharacterized protein (TIGR02145 family)